MWERTRARVPNAESAKSNTGSVANAEAAPSPLAPTTPPSAPNDAPAPVSTTPASSTAAPTPTDSSLNSDDWLRRGLGSLPGATLAKIQSVADGRSCPLNQVVAEMLTFCVENEFYG